MDSKAINQLYESSTLRDGNYHVVPQLICNYEVAKMFTGPNVPSDRLPYHHAQNDHRADLVFMEQITQIIGHMRIVLA